MEDLRKKAGKSLGRAEHCGGRAPEGGVAAHTAGPDAMSGGLGPQTGWRGVFGPGRRSLESCTSSHARTIQCVGTNVFSNVCMCRRIKSWENLFEKICLEKKHKPIFKKTPESCCNAKPDLGSRFAPPYRWKHARIIFKLADKEKPYKY